VKVLFVSKPIAPPWNDGSKNLVRDVASHLTRARPTVLTTPGAPALGPRVTQEPLYGDGGRFAPALAANLRVLSRLVGGDPHDLWHFVFAPNPASSAAARIARTARRVLGWRGPVVQTVASAPKSFNGVPRLLFGDVIVTLSEWTRARLVGNGARADRVRVIPPCAAAPEPPTPEARKRVRAAHDLGTGPIVLYPGDYEVSSGAETVTGAARAVVRKVPEVMIVFACRTKTTAAAPAQDAIVARLKAEGLTGRTRHVGEIEDLPALLAEASVVTFPVDDLYGKVDVPLVLLEALALRTPLVLARGGPLESISSARFVEPRDADGLAREIVAALVDNGRARADADRGLSLYETHFHPRVVAAAYDDLYDDVLRAKA
jgi:glycosyltransferase involved in cell wall biosynthesis